MKILITGSSSFLGFNLTKKLLLEGHEVIGLTRISISDAINHSNYNEFIVDMDCYHSFNLNICLDIIILNAWSGTRGDSRYNKNIQLNNIISNIALVKNLEKTNFTKVINIGSQAEYHASSNFSEKTFDSCFNWYGYSKKKLSKRLEELLTSKIVLVHLRLFSVFGSGDYNDSLIFTIINSKYNKKNINLSCCENDWNYIYIKDLINIMYLMTIYDFKLHRVDYDLSSTDNRKLRDYVVELCEIIDIPTRRIKFCQLNQDCPPFNMSPDYIKLKTDLNWSSSYSFRDGVLDMIVKDDWSNK